MTSTLLLVSLVLPVWCCIRRPERNRSTEIDLFQPGTVLACFFYFYFVVPAFHVWYDLDYHSVWLDPIWPGAPIFQFTLLLSLLSLIAFGVGYRLKARFQPRDPAPLTEEASLRWPATATAAAVVMLVIGLPFRLYHLKLFGGLSLNILRLLSPTYQVESGIIFPGVPTFFEGFFDWGALLLLLRAIITKRQRLLTYVIVLVALGLAFLLGAKRSAVFPFLLYPATWVHYLRRRISVKRGLAYFAAAFLFITVLLFMRSVGPLLVTSGVSISSVPADIALAPVSYYINSPDLNIFDITMFAVQDRGVILHNIGGRFWGAVQYNVAPIAYIVPRFLWPGKPAFTDLGQLVFQLTADVSGREDVGFAVGAVGGLYVFAGLTGVLLGMMIIGGAFRFVYDWLAPWRGDPRRVFLYGIALWMGFMLLRFGTLSGTLLYFYQFQLVGVIAALAAPNAHRTARRESPPSVQHE